MLRSPMSRQQNRGLAKLTHSLARTLPLNSFDYWLGQVTLLSLRLSELQELMRCSLELSVDAVLRWRIRKHWLPRGRL
jgi:hypothetical protein